MEGEKRRRGRRSRRRKRGGVGIYRGVTKMTLNSFHK